MKKPLGLFLLVFLLIVVFAGVATPFTYAMEQIIRPYQSIRSAGMGGVKITTGEYEENLYGNPARTAANPTWRVTLFDISAESSTTTITNVQALSKAKSTNLQPIANTVGNNLHARVETSFPGFYHPNPDGKFAWALALQTSEQVDLIARRNYQVDPDTVIDVGPTFSLARRYLKDSSLVAGINARLAYRASTARDYSLSDVVRGASFSPTKNGDNGTMFDFDIGATYDFNHWTPHDFHFHAGLAINNMLDGNYSNIPFHPVKAIGTSPTQQPRSLGIGGSVTRESIAAGHTHFTNFIAAIEFYDIGNNPSGSMFRTVHIGGEIRWKFVKPRLGLYQGYPTAGVGFDLKLLSIDVATYGEEMSLNAGGKEDRRFALHLALHI